MDLKSILSNFPWVASKGEVPYNFFRDRDIRKVALREWRLLVNRHLAGEDKKPFCNIRNPHVYIVPYYGSSGIKPDHYIGLTEDLKPLREFGTDPFPYGLRSLDRYKDNYILCNWSDYARFQKENSTIEKPSLIVDAYTDFNNDIVLDTLKFDWVSLVKDCNFVLIESRNQLDFEDTRRVLDKAGLKYKIKPLVEHAVQEIKNEPVKEVVAAPVKEVASTPVKKVSEEPVKEVSGKDGYYNRQELVNKLKSFGIEATVDMLRRIPEYVDVPHKIDEKTKVKLYSSYYHRIYFKYRDSGCTRKVAAEESLKEYMSHT